MAHVLEVPIDRIDPNPENPRKGFSEESLAELSKSIREVGILQPLVVVECEGGRYRLVAGERRWKAARDAGLETVPVVVRDLTPEQEAQVMLIENLQREDLNPIEEAQALKELLMKHGWKQEELAEKLGVSQPYIANRIRLLDLPESVQDYISRGILSPSLGRELLAFKKIPGVVEAVAEEAKNRTEKGEGFSVKEALESAKREAWNRTRPLHKSYTWNQPLFSLQECEKCKHKVFLADPYLVCGSEEESKKKFPRCLNVKCWDKKQKEVEKESEREEYEAALKKAEELGVPAERVYKLETLYQRGLDFKSFYPWERNFDTEGCSKCEYRGVAYVAGTVREICLNPVCFEEKNKAAKEQIEAEKNLLKEELEREKEKIVNRDFRDFVEDKDLLVYLAAKALYVSNLNTAGRVLKKFCKNEGWRDTRKIEKDGLLLAERLRDFSNEQLLKVLVFALVEAADEQDELFRKLVRREGEMTR